MQAMNNARNGAHADASFDTAPGRHAVTAPVPDAVPHDLLTRLRDKWGNRLPWGSAFSIPTVDETPLEQTPLAPALRVIEAQLPGRASTLHHLYNVKLLDAGRRFRDVLAEEWAWLDARNQDAAQHNHTQLYFQTGAGDAADLAREIVAPQTTEEVRRTLMTQGVGEAYLVRRGEPGTRLRVPLSPDPAVDPDVVQAVREAALRRWGRPTADVEGELAERERLMAHAAPGPHRSHGTGEPSVGKGPAWPSDPRPEDRGIAGGTDETVFPDTAVSQDTAAYEVRPVPRRGKPTRPQPPRSGTEKPDP